MMKALLLTVLYVLSYSKDGYCSTQSNYHKSGDFLQSNPAFDKYVELLLDELHVPGLSVAVVDLKQTESSQISAKVLPMPGKEQSATDTYTRAMALHVCRQHQPPLTRSTILAAQQKHLLLP